MPEASVDEDCRSILGKDQIGPSRKVATMQAETHPASVKKAADNHLGLRVASTNGRHDTATSLAIKYVSHDLPVYDSASVAQSREAPLDRVPLMPPLESWGLHTLFPHFVLGKVMTTASLVSHRKCIGPLAGIRDFLTPHGTHLPFQPFRSCFRFDGAARGIPARCGGRCPADGIPPNHGGQRAVRHSRAP